MTDGKSVSLKNSLAGLLRNPAASVNPPAGGYWVGLADQTPSDTTFSEIAGNGYARIQVPPSAFGKVGDRAVSNIADIEFQTATPAGWTVRGVGLFSTASGGTGPDWFGGLENGITISANGRVYFPAYTESDPGLLFRESQSKQYSSDWWADQKLSLILGDSLPSWGKVYIALGTTEFDGQVIGEISGGGYKRKEINCATTEWDAQVNGETKNSKEIVFDGSTADWAKIGTFGICTALTGGEIIWGGDLPNEVLIYKKDKLLIPVGKLRCGEGRNA